MNYVGAGLCTLQASVTQGTNHLAATGAGGAVAIGGGNIAILHKTNKK